MQATKRYVLLLATIIFLVLFYNGYKLIKQDIRRQPDEAAAAAGSSISKRSISSEDFINDLTTFINPEYFDSLEKVQSPSDRNNERTRIYKKRKCRMESCFDYDKCRKYGFKIYVYPDSQGEIRSLNYKNFLHSIRNSNHCTTDPEKACLFVLSYDTLDRDPLSKDFIPDLEAKIKRLKYWNNGRNHVIFNLYSGTFPDYLEDVSFDLGEAILAKASYSDNYYRHGFDVSLPLVGKLHPNKSGDTGQLKANYFPPRRKYMLSFKGKRYTYGIGSNTRNALYHIHNGDDIIMLTTCKHGSNWEKYSDAKCAADNAEYDKWDYWDLLLNSTFCVIPRGRRLGSFRFLESLQYGCIPISLANGWMLPFQEVIDWSRASVVWEERLLLQLPTALREMDDDQILFMRQQSQFLWNRYFSSAEVIMMTTFEILYDRIFPEKSRPRMMWNADPGPLFYAPDYSTSLTDYPAYYKTLGLSAPTQFTALIQATSPVTSSAAPIVHLVRNLLHTVSCAQIVILWHCGAPPPPEKRWGALLQEDGAHNISITVIDKMPKVMSLRFYPYNEIKYDCVLHLDDDATLNTQEIDFSFEVWRVFPERIVGFPARNHYWDSKKNQWSYTSKWSNSYSMVLTGAAYTHRYYLSLFIQFLPAELINLVDDLSNCEDILMNFLVSHVTRLPPIKVTNKKQYKDSTASQEKPRAVIPSGGVISEWYNPKHFADRQTCMLRFVEWFGYMPLMYSETRLDPALFKDKVSIARKRYPKIEG